MGAEVVLPARELAAELAFFIDALGFRPEAIYPADDPAVAILSGHGLRLRLVRVADAGALGATGAPGLPALRLPASDVPALAGGPRALTSPSGIAIELAEPEPPMRMPVTAHQLVVTSLDEQASWGIGRAGMLYRDLIPGRLGGRVIASHIRIPDAGPVPDRVHYHTIGFQLIFCVHGWVRLVYEDQGPPFVLHAGDCVIQPPQIRHRVLESSAQLEVVEVGAPAEHLTTFDHELTLPTAALQPEREFGGQRFWRSELARAPWRPWRIPGFEARDSGVTAASGGVASVVVARPAPAHRDRAAALTSHASDVLFTFVLSGGVTLDVPGQTARRLGRGDAFVVPPHLASALRDGSADLQLLEVSLPATFLTVVHAAPG
jgi:quercetin dioxygenase-like cupin family protein